MFRYAGPPLHETMKLLSPLVNLEAICLSGNKLGGNITADAAGFAKLKVLKLAGMGLDGKSLSAPSRALRLPDFC